MLNTENAMLEKFDMLNLNYRMKTNIVSLLFLEDLSFLGRYFDIISIGGNCVNMHFYENNIFFVIDSSKVYENSKCKKVKCIKRD